MHTNKALANRFTLFKTMSGSRLYGTNTPTSDIDWKEIFLPEKSQMLIGRKLHNVVISTASDNVRNTKDDVDYEYIPIQVFANDFYNGQTYAIELAYAVLSEHRQDGQELYSREFLTLVYELTRRFQTSNIKAMVGYALNQAQLYGVKGSRLASIRKFTDKIDQELEAGRLSLDDKLSELELWAVVNSDKYMYVTSFMSMDIRLPAISILEKMYPMTITIGEVLQRTKAAQSKYGVRTKEAETANGMDWKATSHAVRITLQAISLLTDNKLSFPLQPERIDQLLRIKRGEVPAEEVKLILEKLFDDLDIAKEQTTLPTKNQIMDEQFEEWLKDWMVEFYQ